jgi:phage protein D
MNNNTHSCKYTNYEDIKYEVWSGHKDVTKVLDYLFEMDETYNCKNCSDLIDYAMG